MAPEGKGKGAKKAAAKKTSKTTKKSVVKPTPKPRLDPVIEQFGPRLRAELEQVAKSEAKILKALTNTELSQQYLVDPAGALTKMGVELPPILKRRLKERPPINDFVGPRSFRLPNGQLVTATVNVRFTARKEV